MMSVVDTVRADLTALRTDNEEFHSDIKQHFTRLEAEIDKKPNITTILLAMLITIALITGIIGIVAVLMVGL
jgi:hypothetical protein